MPAGFNSTIAGTVAVGPGGSTTLALMLDAVAPGWYGGEVSFGNNDADEHPFSFWLEG